MRYALIAFLWVIGTAVHGQIVSDSLKSDTAEFNSKTAEMDLPEQKNESMDSSEAAFRFSTTDYDFGEIKKGEKVKHVFSFKFTGSDTLIITDVTVDCGCTVPSLDKNEYYSGETGQIEVIYDSKDDIGRVLQYITVLHNQGEGYTFLTMSGFVLTSF